MSRSKKTVVKFEPKRCYVCGRPIRFINTADPHVERGYYICDFDAAVIARSADGAPYVVPGGLVIKATKDLPLGCDTAAVGYRMHNCRAATM